ncbi:DNA adenine methylase [Anaerostipes sp.]|uniref:DNA adenine methylase n=1 Tax=Anaerostipes sp. TaxID=1872530 RepID=UPI0025B7AACC|nr:Dam family site-specific DNA-(adenine-N6)-methyltransferase [Anaerostipes sp.]MBS7006795.1 DNA adenine methylase [Anaerostipes sp.]
MIPALLKWIGNKRKFAELIVSYMPEDFNDYYEPFLGSGAVMAELLHSDINKLFPHFKKAHGSDVLPFLIDIFKIVKNNPDDLVNYYKKEIEEYYLDPKNKYLEIRDRFNQEHNAYDFCLLSRTCYSGVIRFRKADGYMSTPQGPHKPISPETFKKRVNLWNSLLKKADFKYESYIDAMDKAQAGDVVYCDPPYTHSQSIIYGAQDFDVNVLFAKIAECKERGVKVMLSINGMKDSKKTNISVTPPDGLFERKFLVNCGTSMIDRLQNDGKTMKDKKVDDQLLLTW